MQSQTPFRPHYDAIIVGSRCAGAATAMLLARQGARVLLVDAGKEGTDTMSTHALMRGAVMQLSSWGLLDHIRQAGTPAIRKTAFVYGEEVIDIDIKPSHGVESLYAPRRFLLDRVLVGAARDAGADVRFGLSCSELLFDGERRVRGIVATAEDGNAHAVTSNIVIGADGRSSTVAERAGARLERKAAHAAATVYGYFGNMPNNGNRWYYAAGAAAGSIPTNDGLTCVFASMPRQNFLATVRGRLEQGLRHMAAGFAELEAELADAVVAGPLTGFIGQAGYMRQAAGPGWALVGDAGYFKDPLTAHGITDALRDAEILAQVITGGGYGNNLYQQARDALSHELFAVTDEIASFDWSLDELKSMHKRLNRAMKAEQDWMLTSFKSRPLAA